MTNDKKVILVVRHSSSFRHSEFDIRNSTFLSMERILIIEDELPMRTALTDVLTSEGYRVLGASDGEAGLQRAMLGALVDRECCQQRAVGNLRQMLRFLRGAAAPRQRGGRNNRRRQERQSLSNRCRQLPDLPLHVQHRHHGLRRERRLRPFRRRRRRHTSLDPILRRWCDVRPAHARIIATHEHAD